MAEASSMKDPDSAMGDTESGWSETVLATNMTSLATIGTVSATKTASALITRDFFEELARGFCSGFRG